MADALAITDDAALAALSQILADWYWECDLDLRFRWHELAGRRLSAEHHQPVEPRWLDGRIAPLRNEHRPTFEAAARSQRPFRNVELVCTLADGSLRPLIASGEPRHDPLNGQLLGFRGLARDLATRSRTEELFHLEHEVARALADADGIESGLQAAIARICCAEDWPCGEFWGVDENQQWLRFVAGWDRLDEQSRAHILAARPATFARGMGLAGHAWQEVRAIWTGDVHNDPRLLRKDMAQASNLRSAFVFPAQADGSVAGVFAFWSQHERPPDARLMAATEALGRQVAQFLRRREAEAVLRESEARFRALTALSADGYWETDPLGRLTRIEGRWATLDANDIGLHFEQLGFASTSGTRLIADAMRAQQPIHELALSRRVDGELRYVSLSGEPMNDRDGRFAGYRGVSRDITERRRDEERIRHMALHDALTGLPNRTMFGRVLAREIESARRHGRQATVLFIDLDRFKAINDTLGHDAGDELLREVARRFRASLRASDTLARLGGDEFVVLLDGSGKEAPVDVGAVAAKLLAVAESPICLRGRECRVSASIGIATFPDDAGDESSLMRHADLAMYAAKATGKNRAQPFDPRFRTDATQRMETEVALRAALSEGQLQIHFQPKVAMADGRLTGAEALLRWHHAVWGWVPPARFIPIAEDSGLIVPIGRFVLRTACSLAAQWRAGAERELTVAVNVSQRQLADPGFIDDVESALAESGLAPGRLELEITESAAMADADVCIALLHRVRQLGVRLAIDDFGTGYSSLAQLKRFPVDSIKIDRSFVREISQRQDDHAIAGAIIAMGHALRMAVVAEGVETETQLAALKGHGCDEMQGYLYAKPMPPQAFDQHLSAPA